MNLILTLAGQYSKIYLFPPSFYKVSVTLKALPPVFFVRDKDICLPVQIFQLVRQDDLPAVKYGPVARQAG